jgi:hypothetical protein
MVKMNDKASNKSNDESFQNMLRAMWECSHGQEKLHLVDQMASLNPRSTERALMRDGHGLAPFDGLFTPDGQPSDLLGTVSKFGSYL